MKKLAIIPAFNEAGNIENVIKDLKENAPDFDFIVINDCSGDGTDDILRKIGCNYLNLPINLGIGGCVQTGMKWSYRNNYDLTVQFDGDGQHDAKYLNLLVEEMQKSGSDMVIGSRFIEKEGFQSYMIRRAGIKYFTILIKLLTGKKITDPTSGMRLMNRNLVKEYIDFYPKDYPEPESAVIALSKGYSISEIPVIMHERNEGKSSINLKAGFYYMIKVTFAMINARIDRKNRQKKV
ncbi:MAG: glycosyltransferase family 2 protein [Eubacterium sp.]|nr:glycosyltransferase family 2 protein [Eubacterium sp.]